MNGKKMHRYLWKSGEKLPLIFMIAAIACLGIVLFHHVSLSSQAPIWDALGYAQKGKNFWDAITHGKCFNPLNLEPSYRPPGTVLMSYPFGFSENPHGFYFRSLFIPMVLFVSALWIVARPTCSRPEDRWLLASLCLGFAALPLFYHLEQNPQFWSPTYWGLVDNFLAGIAALATALTLRGVDGASCSFTLLGIVISAFCLLIKPAGALVMAVIFFIWAVYSWAQYRPLRPRLAHNDKVRRYIMVSLSGYIVIYGLVALLSFGSQYLSSGHLDIGKRAVELLQKEWSVRDWWPLLKLQIQASFGWHWIAFVLALCGLSIWLQLKRPNEWFFKRYGNLGMIDLLGAAAVFLIGIWFWIFQAEQSQIRYFFPFAFICITLCFPRITFTCIAIPLRFKKLVCCLLICQFALLVLLLIPNNTPASLQEVFGVNLTSGSLKEEVKQAKSLVELSRHERKDLIVYFASGACPSGVFVGVGWYTKILKPNQYSFASRYPIDWVKGSTFRFADILESDYLAFEPIRDAAERGVILGRFNVPDFYTEIKIFRAWLTTANEESGLKVQSETSLRLVRVVDKTRLEDALMRLARWYRWRKAFLDANRGRWIERGSVEALNGNYGEFFKAINFDGRFISQRLCTKETADGLRLDIVWESLKEQRLKYVVFVHVVDAEGTILAQADYIQDDAKRIVAKGTTWHDVVRIPKAKLIGAEAIGIGIYLPPDEFLVADQGPRDWNGRRLLIRVK
jgi:hypothetical protein